MPSIPLSMLQAICNNPFLQDDLTFDKLLKYIEITTSYALRYPFCALSLQIPHEVGKVAWEACQDSIWAMDALSEREERGLRLKHARLFVEHGIGNGIGVFNLEPPFKTCINTACTHTRRGEASILIERTLDMPVRHEITVFTKDIGAVPGFATSLLSE
ncbi:hypothetical protein AAF712_007461 [Marasmius tenuissimus]|uniref:Uncharacterized protein n=1 Tax=Marasmius tenuissimus TaxID=585030 RepID=A0ABR2ZV37_9AGAR